jgi:hypothetical protein
MKGDSDTENTKKEDKGNKGKSRTSKFLKKLDFAQISEIEDNKAKNSDDSKSEDKEDDPHSFSFLNDLLGPERVKNIKSGKNKILMATGIIIGLLFIVFGAIMIMGSADRVADNVVFGEREVFSVFLMLIGVLIIACSLAYKFMGKSFFKEIDNDTNSYEKKSSDSAENNIKKDNINRNNR